MRKKRLILILIGTLLILPTVSYAQEQDSADRVQVLRQAKEYGKTTVAVEAYLVDDILEVTIIARMYGTKPRIYNAILVGPKLGRLSPIEKITLYPKAEDEEASFPTEDVQGGTISFSRGMKEKKGKGALTKELHKFKISPDKILANRVYQLWIKVESMYMPGIIDGFKFKLDQLPQLISQ